MDRLNPGIAHEPLARHRLFRSCDLDEARDQVARVMKPHFLTLTRGDGLAAGINHVPLGAVHLNYVTYGGDVDVDPGPLRDFFVVLCPLVGAIAIEFGGHRTTCKESIPKVCAPSLPLRMHWTPDCSAYAVRIDRVALEEFLSQYAGATVAAPLVFDVEHDPPEGLRRGWLSLVAAACAELDDPDSPLSRHLAVRPFEELLMARLLETYAHNYLNVVSDGETPAPRYIRKAIDFIHASAREEIALTDMARAAGVSVRTLFRGFRHHLGTTPMAYLRTARLDGVRRALLAADDETMSVTRLAADWGFFHGGRFAALYRQRFGESPSETLRRSRR